MEELDPFYRDSSSQTRRNSRSQTENASASNLGISSEVTRVVSETTAQIAPLFSEKRGALINHDFRNAYRDSSNFLFSETMSYCRDDSFLGKAEASSSMSAGLNRNVQTLESSIPRSGLDLPSSAASQPILHQPEDIDLSSEVFGEFMGPNDDASMEMFSMHTRTARMQEQQRSDFSDVAFEDFEDFRSSNRVALHAETDGDSSTVDNSEVVSTAPSMTLRDFSGEIPFAPLLLRSPEPSSPPETTGDALLDSFQFGSFISPNLDTLSRTSSHFIEGPPIASSVSSRVTREANEHGQIVTTSARESSVRWRVPSSTEIPSITMDRSPRDPSSPHNGKSDEDAPMKGAAEDDDVKFSAFTAVPAPSVDPNKQEDSDSSLFGDFTQAISPEESLKIERGTDNYAQQSISADLENHFIFSSRQEPDENNSVHSCVVASPQTFPAAASSTEPHFKFEGAMKFADEEESSSDADFSEFTSAFSPVEDTGQVSTSVKKKNEGGPNPSQVCCYEETQEILSGINKLSVDHFQELLVTLRKHNPSLQELQGVVGQPPSSLAQFNSSSDRCWISPLKCEPIGDSQGEVSCNPYLTRNSSGLSMPGQNFLASNSIQPLKKAQASIRNRVQREMSSIFLNSKGIESTSFSSTSVSPEEQPSRYEKTSAILDPRGENILFSNGQNSAPIPLEEKLPLNPVTVGIPPFSVWRLGQTENQMLLGVRSTHPRFPTYSKEKDSVCNVANIDSTTNAQMVKNSEEKVDDREIADNFIASAHKSPDGNVRNKATDSNNAIQFSPELPIPGTASSFLNVSPLLPKIASDPPRGV